MGFESFTDVRKVKSHSHVLMVSFVQCQATTNGYIDY